MKFSLIVTTQGNRKEDVVRFLQSLKKQKNTEFEVILVDQSEGIEIKKIIESLNINFTIKHIFVSKMSLSKARNIGIKHADGDIICFPDDDCWYEENLLSKIEKKFIDNPKYSVLCFNVYDPNTNKFYGKDREKLNNDIDINLKNIFKIPISVGIFIKIQDIKEIRFDENLGVGARWGSGEETDLIIRLYNKNLKIKYINGINIFHPAVLFTNNEVIKAYKYGEGFGALIYKSINRDIKNIRLIIELFNVLIKSMVGFVIYGIIGGIKSKIYINRFKGIINGIIDSKKYYKGKYADV